MSSDNKKMTRYRDTAREEYRDRPPRNWDAAYDDYTAEGEPPITIKSDQNHIIDILNHGKYNRKLLRLGITLLAVFVALTILTTRWVDLFSIGVVPGWILLVLHGVLVVWALLTYRRNRFSSLQWLMPGVFAVWLAYLFFWLV